jgi:deoxycytidine triphosphate deaminase
MILNSNQILQAHKQGKIIYHSPKGYQIQNFAKNQSVDVHLGDWLYFPEKDIWLNLTKLDSFLVPKNIFFLAYTEEFIGTSASSNLHPQWHLRSTPARLGWGHSKAGWGDVGFHNRWCMEFYACTDIEVKAGMKIAQISFTETLPSDSDYTLETGNYQKESLESLFENWKKEDILPKTDNV